MQMSILARFGWFNLDFYTFFVVFVVLFLCLFIYFTIILIFVLILNYVDLTWNKEISILKKHFMSGH